MNKFEFVADNTVLKLIFLFMLDKMEIPLTENSIIDLCTSRNNWLSYMDCKSVMWELLDVNFICKTVDSDGESRFSLTENGRNCLTHFYLKIPLSIRESIDKFAKESKMSFKRSQEYVGTYTKNTDGSYTVNLKIKDPIAQVPQFEIKIQMANRTTAIEAVKRWKEKAANIFYNVYENLGD